MMSGHIQFNIVVINLIIFIHFHFGHQVLFNDNPNYGYNAATGKYEDLMAAGIIDPTKVSFSIA